MGKEGSCRRKVGSSGALTICSLIALPKTSLYFLKYYFSGGVVSFNKNLTFSHFALRMPSVFRKLVVCDRRAFANHFMTNDVVTISAFYRMAVNF